MAILQRVLWSAGVRLGARREDKKILPIGEEDHLQCTHTHTPAPDIEGRCRQISASKGIPTRHHLNWPITTRASIITIGAPPE